MTTTTCPSHDELHAYSIGLLSDEVSDAVAAHLASCVECKAGLSTLDGVEDTFLAKLRRPVVADPYLEESQCQVAVARACDLSQSSPGSRSSQSFRVKALGEYQLIGELGRGGMGTVYKALQTKLDRVVALKVLSRGRVENPQAISRFEREMRAVGKISHPNVVQAHDAREIDGMPVLIMEFIDGLDLAEIVRRSGPLPVAEACELVRRTALGLQCAHEHGLVHRDIKPSNIMLAAPLAYSEKGAGGEGSPAQVKLLDLGLARFYAEGASVVPLSAGEEMTGTGEAMGTADYMAPEQASDSRTVDIRADIYSLGCTLFKLLSGRAPFSGPEYRATLDKLNAHVHQPVPPIRDIAPEVPEELTAILDRMLAKDPGDRFATPAEVAAVLEPFCKGAILADLIARAMAIDEGSISLRECTSEGPVPVREVAAGSPLSLRERVRVRASASAPRRPLVRRILIGLGFLGALASAFAAGILITIKRDGKETGIEVPDGSHARITADGQLEVTLPGQTKSDGQAPQRKESAVPDEKAIQGTWEVVSSTFKLLEVLPGEEEVAREQVLKTTKVIITAETLKILGSHVTNMAFDYKLRPGDNRDMIDLESRQGVSWGIYQLAGNELKICTSGVGHPPRGSQRQRPSEFWAELGSGKELLVLRRVGDASISADEKAILGTWRVERVVFPENNLIVSGFSDLDQRVVFSPHTMRFVGKQARMRGGPDLMEERGYALNPTDQPKRIDFVGGMMHTSHAVYELRGDQLTLVYAWFPARGDARPSKLAAGPDTAMVVLKRIAETTEKAPRHENATGKPEAEPPVLNPAAEAKALQGRWKVVRIEKGENADAELAAWFGFDDSHKSPASLGHGYLNFKDGFLSFANTAGITYSTRNYVIDPALATRTIDFIEGERSQRVSTALGIYEIDGDRLRLCVAKPLPEVKTEQRPRQFAIQRGSGDILVVLDRVHPSDDEKAMQGRWSVIGRIEDGKPASAKDLQSLTGECEGNTFLIVSEDGKIFMSFLNFFLDAAKQPKTITSSAMFGIYKVENDRLHIAYRQDGPRPEKFESTPGSGVELLVLERPKTRAEAIGPPTPETLLSGGVQPAAPSSVRGGLNLMYFYADWSGPCRQMTPVVETLADEGYAVQRVNIDKETTLAKRFGVTSIPCFVVLEGGRELARIVGGTTLARLKAALQRPLADASPSVPAASPPAVNPAAEPKAIQSEYIPFVFRTTTVTRGDITSTIGASGTIEPEQVVDVGVQVTGMIVSLGVDPRGKSDPSYKDKTIDYGSPVEQDMILAQIDDVLHRARVDQQKAVFARAKAELAAAQIKAKGETSEAAKTAVVVAEAAVAQAQAALKEAEINLGNTIVKSPINGVIIARRVNVGQNAGPSPNSPGLFLIAKDLTKMQVKASVNEADIGRIRTGMEASFRVDAFPGDVFKGTVKQVRLDATTMQNVVFYTVVVDLEKPDRRLLPYMTANLLFRVAKKENVLRVHNAALRWKPRPEWVSPDVNPSPFATNKPFSSRGPLWVIAADGKHVRPVDAQIGLTDGTITEVSGPEVKEGMEVVVGQAIELEPSPWWQPAPAVPPTSSQDKPPAAGPAVELKLFGGKSLDQWREVARTDLDIDTRAKAIEALAYFASGGKSDAATEAIIEALKVDQSAAALNIAYRALVDSGPHGEATIISGIRDKDPTHRHAAINVFSRTHVRATYAVPALIEALDDPDPGIRAEASKALGQIAFSTEHEYKDKWIRIRPEGEIGPTSKVVVPALCKLLKDADPTVRLAAVGSLSSMAASAKASIPDLMAFVEAAFSKLKAASPRSRDSSDSHEELLWAIKALGYIGPAASAAVPLLTTIQQADIQQTKGRCLDAVKQALDSIQGKPKPAASSNPAASGPPSP